MRTPMKFPPAVNKSKVGTYPAATCGGGGYVWDDVLEYRVWCHPEDGGDDYFYAFATFEEAAERGRNTKGAEEPLALILQKEYIDEPAPGKYRHVRRRRITEWAVEHLSRPKRNKRTIPDFLSRSAPPNRLDIIRGKAKPRVGGAQPGVAAAAGRTKKGQSQPGHSRR
jgi:hypothetical protein